MHTHIRACTVHVYKLYYIQIDKSKFFSGSVEHKRGVALLLDKNASSFF